MPLPKRLIEPIYVARSVYQQEELQSVELETVTNTTLTNIIRQLSSLSKHAEDLFGDLARDVGSIGDRANSLQARIDRLAIKVTQLDSTVEDVPLTDITRKKAFKSAKIFDQQIFSRGTMPTPMLETYSQCDKPPPLDKLNIYRDDGKDGLKFYTDPNYFFELWRQEMLKDTERVMHDRCKKTHRPRQDSSNSSNGRGHKKRVRTPHNTREKQRQIAIGHGETLMSNMVYRTPSSVSNEDHNFNGIASPDSEIQRPNSIELRRNYLSDLIDGVFKNIPSQSSSNPTQNKPLGVNQIDPNEPYFTQQMHQPIMSHNNNNSNDLNCHQDQVAYGHGIQTQGMMSPDSTYNYATPTRTKQRPTHPPPAPPTYGSTDISMTSKATTPTRVGHHLSSEREALPPPPSIPEADLLPSGNANLDMIYAPNSGNLNNSNVEYLEPNSREARDMMAQCNNAPIRYNNSLNLGQLNSLGDLPVPPPVVEQLSSPNVAPPPPPPPPPLHERNENDFSNSLRQQIMNSNIINGEHPTLQKSNGCLVMSGGIQNLVPTKKLLPPVQDARTDLMKAIRDGITLRKVEKSEQKENERNNDVASILARRVAIELSESEESDSDDDSEGWAEVHETSA